MGRVIFTMSMSLDGFVAGANDGPDNPLGDDGEALFEWYSGGDTAHKMPGGDWMFHISEASSALLQRAPQETGALITARKTFDIARAWGGQHPMDVPVVVLTHHAPAEWDNGESIFTFVDSIEAAVQEAKRLADGKDVALGTASTFQQALNAGLLDEIHIDLTPVVLGKGVRLFDHLEVLPAKMEQIDSVQGTGVTHLRYRVQKA